MAFFMDATDGTDKLSYEIFSILENKFLSSSPVDHNRGGKVRILSIDDGSDVGGGDGCRLAAASLALLESSLRSRSDNPDARIADFFDVAAGSGLGGVLVSMLFTRGPDGRPLFSAEESLHFLASNHNNNKKSSSSVLKRLLLSLRRRSKQGGGARSVFDARLTLRDALKPVLIPCYDLSTGAPFLFSRADAIEKDAYDFNIRRICAATCAGPRRPVRLRSVDGHTKIVALGGGVAMSNPTAAAITHVLNNGQEFPLADSANDLLVLSLGSATTGRNSLEGDELKIAAGAAADTVDGAVATEFGCDGDYVRVHGDLNYKNVESSLFGGKRISQQTNADKLEALCGRLVREQKRRVSSPIPTVRIKKTMSPPRTSSATTCTVTTVTTTSTEEDSGC